MNADLIDLRSFVAVAELGNFSRAAALLNISQPALSRRIAKLESSLGTRLLERSTRSVALTIVGRALLPNIRRVLESFESSVAGIRDLAVSDAGLVSIAAVPSTVVGLVPAALARFARVMPHVRVRVLDIGANEGLEAVARGEVHFGLNFIGASHPGIDFTPLAEDPLVLICHPDHPLAGRRSVAWTDLAGHKLIVTGRGGGNRALIDAALSAIGLRWTYEVAHVAGALALIEARLGVAVLPRLAVPSGHRGHLRAAAMTGPEISRTIGVLRRQGVPLPVAASRLLECLISA